MCVDMCVDMFVDACVDACVGVPDNRHESKFKSRLGTIVVRAAAVVMHLKWPVDSGGYRHVCGRMHTCACFFVAHRLDV